MVVFIYNKPMKKGFIMLIIDIILIIIVIILAIIFLTQGYHNTLGDIF